MVTLIHFEASSQTIEQIVGMLKSGEAIWIYRKDAIGTGLRIERLKADSVEMYQRRAEVVDLRNRVASLEKSNKDYLDNIQTLDLRISNYIMQVSEAERALKKQKRRTTLATVGGISLSASLLFLLGSK